MSESKMVCPWNDEQGACGGELIIARTEVKWCPVCGGNGEYPPPEPAGHTDWEYCVRCEGSGEFKSVGGVDDALRVVVLWCTKCDRLFESSHRWTLRTCESQC
jgi:hypothetical protein